MGDSITGKSAIGLRATQSIREESRTLREELETGFRRDNSIGSSTGRAGANKEMSTLDHFRANAQSHTIRLADIADRLEEFGNRAFGCQPTDRPSRDANQVEAVPDAQVEQVFQILNNAAFQISRIEDAFSRIHGLV